MKALDGAGVFGLVPHPSAAAVDPGRRRPSPPLLSGELELDCPSPYRRRDEGERMATRGELMRLRNELKNAGQ